MLVLDNCLVVYMLSFLSEKLPVLYNLLFWNVLGSGPTFVLEYPMIKNTDGFRVGFGAHPS